VRLPAALALTALLTFALTACSDPIGDGGDGSEALTIVAGAVLVVGGNDAAATITLAHDRSTRAALDWTLDVPPRVRATPASGRIAAGGSVTIDLDVDRRGLTGITPLAATIRSGTRTLPIELTLEAQPPVAPCDYDPAVRYATVRATPLGEAAAAFAAAGVAPTAVLVGLHDGKGATDEIAAQAFTRGAERTSALAGGLRIESDDPLALAGALARDPRIRWVELDGPILHLTSLGDPRYAAGEQWYLDAFGYAAGRNAGGGATPVVVAVIDSGIAAAHEDLLGALVPGRSFLGFASDEPNASLLDGTGHGTHVAGLIAARTGNGIGIAGIAGHGPVRVQPIRVFDDAGRTSFGEAAAAIRWAVGLPAGEGATDPNPTPAAILNLSFGGPISSALLHEAVIDARCAGALLIAAAGNGAFDMGRRDGVIYPARYPETIAVGSVDHDGRRSKFSDYGFGMLDLMAPGGVAAVDARDGCSGGRGLISTYRGAADAYACLRGTSMAAPLVSGMAALLLARESGRFPRDPIGVARLEAALRRAAAEAPGLDAVEYGRGTLCLDALLRVGSVCAITPR
jgi:subtilisin family serine protease